MFYEIVLEGMKKFAGEILGVVLLIAALKKFKWIRSLFGEYKNLKEDSGNKQSEPEINKSDESKPPIMSDKDFVSLCKSGNVAEIESVINNGANVNARNRNITPLMGVLQCNVELTELAELLIKKGADINAKDNFSNTVLMRAAIRNYTKTAELLIKYGANLDAKNNIGVTALMWAIYKGYTELAELLVKKGADVNAKDNFSCTALMRAAEYGYTKTAELLIKYGADVDAKSNKGWTALMLALNYSHTETADLLRSYGAKE
ncbi:MAG: ankyrin repeat domain-containing protein [Synergistaceae bacterium]|nr:ankyrin repeat domain-containing protein [Synergistaceae bacterium]